MWFCFPCSLCCCCRHNVVVDVIVVVVVVVVVAVVVAAADVLVLVVDLVLVYVDVDVIVAVDYFVDVIGGGDVNCCRCCCSCYCYFCCCCCCCFCCCCCCCFVVVVVVAAVVVAVVVFVVVVVKICVGELMFLLFPILLFQDLRPMMESHMKREESYHLTILARHSEEREKTVKNLTKQLDTKGDEYSRLLERLEYLNTQRLETVRKMTEQEEMLRNYESLARRLSDLEGRVDDTRTAPSNAMATTGSSLSTLQQKADDVFGRVSVVEAQLVSSAENIRAVQTRSPRAEREVHLTNLKSIYITGSISTS